MKKTTHSNIWKNKPSEKSVFVTEFFDHALKLIESDKKKKQFYEKVQLPDEKVISCPRKKDKSQPHLYYYLTKDFEYMVPHYFFDRKELETVLSQFFRDIKINTVVKKSNKFGKFFFVEAKV
ncbi:hypothetical protein JW949_01740 [Candidatus Woesearchaeota archaeon]|nr:hypothetical protein [Candidatus Woesearchaeota archaeon]